jgi:hypothetical protein
MRSGAWRGRPDRSLSGPAWSESSCGVTYAICNFAKTSRMAASSREGAPKLSASAMIVFVIVGRIFPSTPMSKKGPNGLPVSVKGTEPDH